MPATAEASFESLAVNQQQIMLGVERLSRTVSDMITSANIRQDAKLSARRQYEEIKGELQELVSENQRLIDVLSTLNAALTKNNERLARNGGRLVRAFCGLVVAPPATAILLWAIGLL